MKTAIEVTNSELFNDKVIGVDTTGLIGLCGTIEIETADDGVITSTGEHGENDYQKDFGFILKVDIER